MTNLSSFTYQEARYRFVELLRDAPVSGMGVCSQFDDTPTYLVMKYHRKEWEHFSGNAIYPIPSVDNSLTPAESYVRHACDYSLWRGDGLMYRRAYLRYLIRVCDKWGE